MTTMHFTLTEWYVYSSVNKGLLYRVKSLYYYVSIFLTGFRMGVSVSVSQWDSE